MKNIARKKSSQTVIQGRQVDLRCIPESAPKTVEGFHLRGEFQLCQLGTVSKCMREIKEDLCGVKEESF